MSMPGKRLGKIGVSTLDDPDHVAVKDKYGRLVHKDGGLLRSDHAQHAFIASADYHSDEAADYASAARQLRSSGDHAGARTAAALAVYHERLHREFAAKSGPNYRRRNVSMTIHAAKVEECKTK